MKTNYIFVTGGVVSSLGKGVSIASIGTLLQSNGFTVTIQKLDPYINIDPGTMSPFQHGEVYVTEDGAETDLDLGYYERFTSDFLKKENSVSTGQIYNQVIQRERRGDYLGSTVQVIPHITNEIKKRMLIFEKKNPNLDFVLVEIGGTVGDIESIPFLEAIRQMRLDLGYERTLFIHLTLLPNISVAKEIKTKPTQHSVKELLQIGIQPNILICRGEFALTNKMKQKISLFCNVKENRVISAPDLESTIYETPLVFKKEKLDYEILNHFKLHEKLQLLSNDWNPLLEKWNSIVHILKNPKREVNIALIGKYTSLKDAYRSLYEALMHGGIPHDTKVNVLVLDSEKFSKNFFSDIHGILIPGGFGERGLEGKLDSIQYARENKIPFLGICLGMQCASIEFARNVLKLEEANTVEVDEKTIHPVIHLMEDQISIQNKGGTMRLGSYSCLLKEGSLANRAYKKLEIVERHRHRFEFNNSYKDVFKENKMNIVVTSPNKQLVEVIELDQTLHPWFIGTQYHPEFQSSPLNPHPLFVDFIYYSLAYKLEGRK